MSKRKSKKNYLAGHQRSWVWGRHAVRETCESGQWPMRELYLAEELPAQEQLDAAAAGEKLGAVVSIVSYERIRALCGAGEHQGYLARMGPFPYATLSDVLRHGPEIPFYVLLDGIRDAHNFGAIVRSAAAMNATAVVAGGPGKTPINSQTVRTSSGAVNRIPIVMVDSLEPVIEELAAVGVRCIAASHKASTPVWECDFRGAAALLLGNEATGIQPELLARCDNAVAVPLMRSVDSLNVSAAAAVMLYEAHRQRSTDR